MRRVICWLSMAGLVLGGCVSYNKVSEEDGGTADGQTDGQVDGQVDGGDDGLPDAWDGGDQPGDLPGECPVPEPLPVRLQIGDPLGCWDCYVNLGGYGQVVYLGDPLAESTELWLWFRADDQVIRIHSELPDGLRIPVELGETLYAHVESDGPWWVNSSLSLMDEADGPLRIRQVDNQYASGTNLGCPAVEDAWGCGLLTHLAAVFQPDPSLEPIEVAQGGRALVQTSGMRRYKILVGQLHRYLENFCDDLPPGWMQAAVFSSDQVNQCTCTEDADCAFGYVCDTYVNRCVFDECGIGRACPAGTVCDPFTGECPELPPGPLCQTDLDCGEGAVCNPHTGLCVENFCPWVNCAPCSSLLGRCYQCLNDCDCWPGVCDLETESCVPGCDRNKIDFGRGNPDAFELVYLCIDEAFPEPEALLGRFIPSIQCGLAAPYPDCDPGSQLACMSELEFQGPGDRAIDQDFWEGLCAISRLPVVQKMHGGHYLE